MGVVRHKVPIVRGILGWLAGITSHVYRDAFDLFLGQAPSVEEACAHLDEVLEQIDGAKRDDALEKVDRMVRTEPCLCLERDDDEVMCLACRIHEVLMNVR